MKTFDQYVVEQDLLRSEGLFFSEPPLKVKVWKPRIATKPSIKPSKPNYDPMKPISKWPKVPFKAVVPTTRNG